MNIGFGNSWKPGYMHGATFVGVGGRQLRSSRYSPKSSVKYICKDVPHSIEMHG